MSLTFPVPTRSAIVAAIAAAVVLTSGHWADAQQPSAPAAPGGTNIQAEPFNPPPSLSPGIGAPVLDYRQEMRGFIEQLASYARSQSRNFAIIARDAGELIIKRDLQDENIISPARTFMRNIDGVMFDGIFYGYRAIGEKPPEAIQTQALDRVRRAKQGGLNVLSMEFAKERGKVDEIYRAAEAQGIVAAAVPSASDNLSSVPDYPRRPNNENPNNVLAVADVKNFVYIADPAAFGRQDQFALDMQGTNFDLVIVDPFSGHEALSRRAVETLKYKKLGARRLVFARIDIGSAASYRFYWQPGWKEGSPTYIGAPFPGDPDKYFVDYWNLAWQQIMFGSPQSYLYGIINQGYDGVVLEGLNAFLAFEGNVEIPIEFAPLADMPAK